jgi:hypothetical protein
MINDGCPPLSWHGAIFVEEGRCDLMTFSYRVQLGFFQEFPTVVKKILQCDEGDLGAGGGGGGGKVGLVMRSIGVLMTPKSRIINNS